MLEQIYDATKNDLFRSEQLEVSHEIIPGRRKNILIIDDDQDFRLILSEILVEEGFTVRTAKNGEVALTQLQHQILLPDLILVDLMMPIMGGMEFRREQLLCDSIAHIPVLFVTGQGYVDGERCLLKPLDREELLERVTKMLRLK